MKAVEPDVIRPEVLLPIKTKRARRIKKFIEQYIVVPEGILVGKPMQLLPEQDDFIEGVYGNLAPDGTLITRRGIYSMARKNGKTGLISAILGAHIIGPETKQNSQLVSAARSRDQASLVFNYLAKSLRMRNDLHGLVEITDSAKKIKGLAAGSEYKAISADATTAHGGSPALTIHDELGQVIGPQDDLYDALETAGGAQLEPLSLIISTQAPSDVDLLSTLIDDAIRNPTPETVVRLYAAGKDADIFNEEIWYAVNFAMGKYRSYKEFEESARRAGRMPAFEAKFRNLYLNQRVSLLTLLVAPSVWRDCNGDVDDSLFFSGAEVFVGADLSQSKDLTSVVLSVQHPDTKMVHVKQFTFTPMATLEERAKQDRAPYLDWVKSGHLIALPGRMVDYDMVCEYMAKVTKGMNIVAVRFDRWRIDLFKKAALASGFCTEAVQWQPHGQGFRDMSPAIEVFENCLLDEALRHGADPVLTMSAANAIVVENPVKDRKIEKSKSSARIDPMVALVMSVYACIGPDLEEEENNEVTENSFLSISLPGVA